MKLFEAEEIFGTMPQLQIDSRTFGDEAVNLENNANDEDYAGSISSFYKNRNVLITGGSGFVGKVLIEKLLRSFEDLDGIYLLLRQKKGVAAEDRLKELLKSRVFNRIRENNPTILKKVKAIAGDICVPNLGLDIYERKFIIQHINIVFHSAATVRFDEDLKDAVLQNAVGTQRILEICRHMKHLKSFIYVSTAFSNADKEFVREAVYQPSHDPNAILKFIEIIPEDFKDIFTKKFLGNHPNTYTLTKAMAEYIVQEHSSIVPSAIVRPSIITAAWKEPYPGWVDNVSGITGIMMECGRGTIRSIICEEKYRLDIIPVDVVVNTLITAAWHMVQYKSNTVRVYNCTNDSTNPVTWKVFRILTLRYWGEYPSKYLAWYPNFTYRTNVLVHKLCAVLFHLIPSMILDLYLILMQKKPMMLKISQKFYSALIAGSFFSTHEWDFEASSMKHLIKTVKLTDDGDKFEMNLSENNFSWEDYIKEFCLGIRSFVLRDDIESLPQARRKLNRLYWFQKVLKIFLAIAVFYFPWYFVKNSFSSYF